MTTDHTIRYTRAPDAFYESLGSLCLNGMLSIDLIIAGSASAYYSLASMESLISDIGGTIYFAPSLASPYRDHTLAEVHAYLQLLVLNPAYRAVSARLRLSPGLNVAAYHGGLTADPNYSTFISGWMRRLGLRGRCMGADSSVVAELEMDRYIKGPFAYAQFAVL